MEVSEKSRALNVLRDLRVQLEKIKKVNDQLAKIHEEIEEKEEWRDQKEAAPPPWGEMVAEEQAKKDRETRIENLLYRASITSFIISISAIVWMFFKIDTNSVGLIIMAIIASILSLFATFLYYFVNDGAFDGDGCAMCIFACIASVIHIFVAGIFWGCEMAMGIVVALPLAVAWAIAIICFFGRIVINITTTKKSPRYAQLIKDADQKRAEHCAREEAKRNARIEEFSVFLDAQKAKIEQLEKEKKTYQAAVRSNNCLSAQDKNLSAVNALITYLERGQADTIKEALNLYDAKCERDAHESARWQAQSFYEQQRLNEQRRAMARMAEEQEDHNRRIREAQAKRDEKIDEAIREMKEKLNE